MINNIKNTTRYSKLPRYAYGTKKVPKYGAGVDLSNSEARNDADIYNPYMSALTTSENQKQKARNKDQTAGVGDMVNAGAETYLSSTPYYGIAKGASDMAVSALGKKQTVNPVTGEVTEGSSSQEDQQMNTLFTPTHTTVINDAKKGDWGGAAANFAGFGWLDTAIKGNKEFDDAKKRNDDLTLKMNEQKTNQKNALEAQQRDTYSRAYIARNPIYGDSGASIYKYGTALPKYNFGSNKTVGGELQPLASNVKKAIGDTHDEDSDNDGQSGITLHDNNGIPKAEVENQEVIVDNNKVLSNRLPFMGKETFADAGEKLGKEKAKNENDLKTGDMFTKNTAKLNLRNIDDKMNKLFKYQDIVRKNLGIEAEAPVKMAYGTSLPKYWKGTPGSGIEDDENNPLGYRPKTQFEANKMYQMETNRENPNFANYDKVINTTTEPVIPTSTNKKSFNTSKYMDMAGTAIPYLDNAINANLIKQTPNIPNPVKREYLNEVAMPLKTTFNINPQLAANTRDLREYNANILNNSATSNDARSYIAKGLSGKLQSNNALYGQKENTETQLNNEDSLNRQAVNNRNIGNRQNINNQNNELTDKYNWNDMLRSDDIRRQKSILGKETTDDMIAGVQDKRAAKLDNDRIMLDSSKYSDGAGLASMMGTNQMDKLSETKDGRKKIRETLERTGQKDALKKHIEKYGQD
jgi:hypothetical protein